MSIVAVVPMLSESSRIPNKNTLLVDGEPLAFYIIKACKKADVFDEIYINSSDDLFRRYADLLDVEFYERDSTRGGHKCTMSTVSKTCKGERCPIHDHFLYDFMKSVDADYVVQAHTTSPTVTSITIEDFVDELEGKEALFTARAHQIESFLGGAVNFEPERKTPSQELDPAITLTWGLTGWDRKKFLERFDAGKSPTWPDEVVDLFFLNQVEAIDVDDWDDLAIAEAVLSHRRRLKNFGQHHFHEGIEEIERNVVESIKQDSVDRFTLEGHNSLYSNLSEIIDEMGDPPWAYPLVYTDQDQVCLIAQSPGEECRKHYHTTKHEWWLVLTGQFKWETSEGDILANAGDIITLPHGASHKITCIGDETGIRLAAGARDMEHIYI